MTNLENPSICSGKCDEHHVRCIAYDFHLGPHLCRKCLMSSSQRDFEENQDNIRKFDKQISNLRVKYAE